MPVRSAAAAALSALAVLTPAVLTPTASAQTVVPFAGEGENLQPVVRVKVPRVNEVELAGDWAFLSTDSGDEGEGGLAIVNIKDPTKPFVEGTWNAAMAKLEGSYGDVDISPDGKTVYLTNAHGSVTEHWIAIIDVTDKSKPKLIGKIDDDDTMDYVHTANLDNNLIYLNPQVAPFFPQPGNAHITVFDVSDPAKPVKKGTIATATSDTSLAHDSYIDHRPDGKTLLYGASIFQTDVWEVTAPGQASFMQTIRGDQTISHDVQPNHDRTVIIVDDEGALGGQLDENVSACSGVGSGPAKVNSGSVHFYPAAPDGSFANGGLVKLGSFNKPANVNTGACVAHVFWQAPNENRLTQAYYRQGTSVLDFSDPANPTELGNFITENTPRYWSFKPHKGFIYGSNMEDGLDIFKYTGEGGTRWPATAGPAEVQRAARQGVPYVPMEGVAPTPTTPAGVPAGPAAPVVTADTRKIGRFAFKARARKVAGKKGSKQKLLLGFIDSKGRSAGKIRIPRRAGGATTVSVKGIGVVGKYRWILKSAGKAVGRGTFTVKQAKGSKLKLSATAKILATSVK